MYWRSFSDYNRYWVLYCIFSLLKTLPLLLVRFIGKIGLEAHSRRYSALKKVKKWIYELVDEISFPPPSLLYLTYLLWSIITQRIYFKTIPFYNAVCMYVFIYDKVWSTCFPLSIICFGSGPGVSPEFRSKIHAFNR